MKPVHVFGAALVAALLNTAAYADIVIKGNNKQTANINGLVRNSADGSKAKAVQNIASNKGNVKINGDNEQTVDVKIGGITNTAKGANTKATQNLASNNGKVTITGTNTQKVTSFAGGFINEAKGNKAEAHQNLASNDSTQ